MNRPEEPDPRAFLLQTAKASDGMAAVDPGMWLVSDPVETERILATGEVSTAREALRTAVTSWGPGGLDRWMAARRAMRPALGAWQANALAPEIADFTRQEMTRWPGPDGIDAMAEAEKLVSAINGRYVLGQPSGDVPLLIGSELDAAEAASVQGLGSWRRKRRLLRAQHATYAAILACVRSHVPAPDRPVVLDVLTRPGLDFDERTIVLTLRTMLLAGHRVPAAALAWTLYELASHPEMQERARQEAAAHPAQTTNGGNTGTDMRYSQAVIRETLRLHPPVWQFQRRLTAPAAVGGLALPTGTNLLFSSYVNQRDHRVYPDPDEFRPERWQTPGFHPGPGNYFPFGAGPRFCPGTQLALTELTTILATTLTTHRLTVRRPPSPSHGVLYTPDRCSLDATPTGH